MRLVAAFVLGAFLSTAHGALVQYVVEGQLEQVLGNDSYNLDGADFRFVVRADTDDAPVSLGQGPGPDGQSARYQSNNARIRFTSRPSAAPDANVATTAPFLDTVNYPVGGTSDDNFDIKSVNLTGPFADLTLTSFQLYFPQDFYPIVGFATLPTELDLSQATAAYFGSFASQDGSVRYTPTTWTVSGFLVPEPATLTLMILGLLGVECSQRRRGQAMQM